MKGAEIKALIERHRFAITSEAELQRAVCEILTRQNIPYQTEVRMGPRDRLDILVGSVGLELKVKSLKASHIEQIWRYLQHPSITEMVYVTTRRTASLGPELLGKPVLLAIASV